MKHTPEMIEAELLEDARVLCSLVNKAIEEDHKENEAYFLPQYYSTLNAVNRYRQEMQNA